jgi:hypothetical protein
MIAAEFNPEFAPEQIEFITARRFLIFSLISLCPSFRLSGFPDSSSAYQIYGYDGFEIR